MKKILNLVPSPFNQLLALVSPATLNVISIRQVLAVSRDLVRSHKNEKLNAEILDWLEVELGEIGITEVLDHEIEFDHMSEDAREALGDAILDVYFRQFLNSKGIFLDIRPSRLQWQDSLTWSPNLAYRFSEHFRNNIVALYQSFYRGDKHGHYQALLGLGLVSPDWQQEKVDEISQLLTDHFGSSLEEKTLFSMDMFLRSSSKLFNFLSENDVDINREFLVFGLYLICLYVSLSQLNVPLDVNAAVNRSLLNLRG